MKSNTCDTKRIFTRFWEWEKIAPKKKLKKAIERLKNSLFFCIKYHHNHQMALKFHPDKNRAPGSDEIFKKVRIYSKYPLSFYIQVAQAYDCLSNKEKRACYDKYGDEDPDQHYQDYYKHFSEEVSPEVNIYIIFLCLF